MSLYFILNNLHFALEMFGALAFLMVSWLAFDAFSIRRDFLTASRAFGFLFLTIWQVFLAFDFADENLKYLGMGFFILGLVTVVINLLLEAPVDRPEFKLILPPIATMAFTINSIITFLFAAVTFTSFRQYFKESKVAIRLFGLGFLSLTIGYAIALINDSDAYNLLWGIQHIFQFIGFCLIIGWVWQYLQLRVREELLMIFFSAALFISTVATLVFSMVNAVRIEALTADNLTTNAKLFDLSISNLKDNVLSKTELLAKNDKVLQALNKDNAGVSRENMDTLAANMTLKSLTVVDTIGNSTVQAFSDSTGLDLSREGIIKEALAGNSIVAIDSKEGEGVLIKSAVPLTSGDSKVGALIAGFPLDSAFIDNINRITNLDMAIYFGDTVVASTAFGTVASYRVGTKETDSTVLDKVLNSGETLTTQTTIASKPYVASYMPIYDYQNKVVGMISVAKSQHDILEISNETNRVTLVTILIIMLILIAPFYLFTKRLSEESH